MVVPVSIDLDSLIVEWVWLDHVVSVTCFMTVCLSRIFTRRTNGQIDGNFDLGSVGSGFVFLVVDGIFNGCGTYGGVTI
jgi:hypothetical protein